MSCRQIPTVSKVLLSTVGTVLELPAPSVLRRGGVGGCSAEGQWVAPVRAQSGSSPTGPHSLLSGDLSPLGLGLLHLTIPGRDLGGGGREEEEER